MSRLTIFRSRVPAGMRIFEYGVEVAGIIKTRRYNARKFVSRSNRRLYLERAPAYPRTPGAIRVIGKSRGWFFERSRCIGYVPDQIAQRLTHSRLENKVAARLRMVSIGAGKAVEIRFDLLGPEDEYETYCA